MRTIKAIHKTVYEPIDDLITYRAMPTHSVSALDPFLFLNHHGHQTYPANNSGLPFGPHPHRGFETLTYIFKGDVKHKDTGGGESIINEGGVQWMTAGRGLIHAEVSSEDFKKAGGELELIQIWMNLPSKYKMVDPQYEGLQKDGLNHFSHDDGKVNIHLISGGILGQTGPIKSITGLTTSHIDFNKGGALKIEVPKDHQILFYVVNGNLNVNGKEVQTRNLVEFGDDDLEISITADEESHILFCHGEPTHEPIVAHGPFVMNYEGEIKQAILDYQSGKMGVWDS